MKKIYILVEDEVGNVEHKWLVSETGEWEDLQ